MSDMITIEDGIEIAKNDVISVFSDIDKLTPYLNMIADQVTVPESEIDLTTDKGRKAIASRAHKVSKVKTQLVKVGKDSVADLKKQVTTVGAGIKFVEENLSTLRDTTKAPLTAWQAEQDRIEEERVNAIKEKIASLYDLGSIKGGESIDEISSMIDALSNIDCSEGFDEFATDALKAIAECKDKLSDHMQQLIQQKQQEELNRQLEAERKANEIKDRLNKLRMIPMDFMGKSSDAITKKLTSLQNYEIPQEEFGDSYQEAIDARTMVIQQLGMMKDQALLVEKAEQDRLDAEAAKPTVTETPAVVQYQNIVDAQSAVNQQLRSIADNATVSETPDAWRDQAPAVVPASEVLDELVYGGPSDEAFAIADHIQQHCNIEKALALVIAECLTTTQVPFISFTRKAA